MPRYATMTALLVSLSAAPALAGSEDPQSHEPIKLLHPEFRAGEDIWAISWSPDAHHLLIENGFSGRSLVHRYFLLWNIAEDAPALHLRRYGNARFLWSDDHGRLVIAGSGHISIHNVESGEVTAEIEHEGLQVPSNDNWWSPDGRWVVAEKQFDSGLDLAGHALVLFDLHDPEADPVRLKLIEPEFPGAHLRWDVHWDERGPSVAIGRASGEILVWSPFEDQSNLLQVHHSRITSLAWSQDGERIAIGAQDGTAHIVHIPRQDRFESRPAGLIRIEASDHPIQRVSFINDDSLLRTTDLSRRRIKIDQKSRVWSVKDGARVELETLTQIDNRTGLHPTRCGRFIMRVETPQLPDEFTRLEDPVGSAAVQILDAASRATLAQIKTEGLHAVYPSWTIELCAQSPDNSLIAIPTTEGAIGIWNLDEMADH